MRSAQTTLPVYASPCQRDQPRPHYLSIRLLACEVTTQYYIRLATDDARSGTIPAGEVIYLYAARGGGDDEEVAAHGDERGLTLSVHEVNQLFHRALKQQMGHWFRSLPPTEGRADLS